MVTVGQHDKEWGGDKASTTMIPSTTTKMTRTTMKKMGMGSSFHLVMLLRRIGGGLPQTGTDNGGNVGRSPNNKDTRAINRLQPMQILAECPE